MTDHVALLAVLVLLLGIALGMLFAFLFWGYIIPTIKTDQTIRFRGIPGRWVVVGYNHTRSSWDNQHLLSIEFVSEKEHRDRVVPY